MNDPKQATLDDLFITRDNEGEIVPIVVESSLLGGTVSIIPATYGYIKKKGLDMQVSAVQWSTEAKLEFIQTHIISPDVSSLSLEDTENNMGPMTLNHLVSLVVAQSIPMNRLRQDVGPLAEALKSVLLKNALKTQNTPSTPSDIPT